ncbi:hypothetical protein B0H10DRAFT_1976905 [Mycena sp. CBHHK59/15]|nr:hypothetical protein B0H10DRAFT_1976905 [Mycena sp. CBHHK59/15]
MLPFGLKLAWFALSLSGLIGCWAVLLPLAWATQSYWGPIAYAVGITALEGMFCLGLIWRMNPANMPQAFCLAQTLVTGLATFFLVGVIATITTATSMYVAKPKQWGTHDETAVLSWQIHYLLPMLLFPLVASCVHTTFVVFFDTFQAVDGLACVALPRWTVFLGYAGTPFLITIPCLLTTTISLIRVLRTHKHIRRARRSVPIDTLDHFTALPHRKSRPALSTRTPPETPLAITAPSPSTSEFMRMARDPRRQAISPILREEKIRSFHMPLFPPSTSYVTARSGHRSYGSDDFKSFDTVSSVSFAEVTTKSSRLPSSQPPCDSSDDDVLTPLRSYSSPAETRSRSTPLSSPSIHNSDRISITELAYGMQHEESGDSSDYYAFPRRVSSEAGSMQIPPPFEHRSPSELSSIVWSLLIFQFAIIGIHLLSSITPIIDVVSARSAPAALGTQHVALILAGWAPVVIFGPLTVVRSQLRISW